MNARMTWICHASTPAIRGGAFPTDEPIDQRGRAGCAAAAGSLRRADRIWTAPELRARQTAEGLGLTAISAPDMRDCDYGRWSGLSLAKIGAEEPSALAQWLSNPEAAPHGGESITGMMARVSVWIDALGDVSGHSIVVAHPMVLRAAILHVIRAGAESFWRLDVAPLSQALFTRGDGAWRFRALGALESRNNQTEEDPEA